MRFCVRTAKCEFQILGVGFALFRTSKYKFLETTVRTSFHGNRWNQPYLRHCVQIFNCFCLVFKLLLKYILINPFKIIYRAHWHICVQNFQCRPFIIVRLPMSAVQNRQISTTQLWSSFEITSRFKRSCDWNYFLTMLYIY